MSSRSASTQSSSNSSHESLFFDALEASTDGHSRFTATTTQARSSVSSAPAFKITYHGPRRISIFLDGTGRDGHLTDVVRESFGSDLSSIKSDDSARLRLLENYKTNGARP